MGARGKPQSGQKMGIRFAKQSFSLSSGSRIWPRRPKFTHSIIRRTDLFTEFCREAAVKASASNAGLRLDRLRMNDEL